MGFLGKILGKDKTDNKIYHSRGGKLVESDDRHMAVLSGDFNQMLKYLHKNGDLIDTHFLYLGVLRQAYAKRKDPKMREIFKREAANHAEAFGSLVGPLKREMKDLPHVPTFQWLATVYVEDGEYEKAIEVCKKAIGFGLEDGTKGGYQGRIERIKKKMKTA